MIIKPILKYLLIALILVTIIPSAIYLQNTKGTNDGRKTQTQQDYSEREEIRQTYQLAPGASVELSIIDGPKVEIETSDSNQAEILIVRSARTREDLNFRKINIQPSANSLVIRGVNDPNRNSRVRQDVRLKLPRKIALVVKDISAPIKIGEIDGAMRLDNISGPTTLAQSVGCFSASQISGPLTVTVANLASCGVKIEQVSGPVDITFKGQLNADFNISGFRGLVGFGASTAVTILQKTDSLVKARVGSGGTPVTISGIRGGVSVSIR